MNTVEDPIHGPANKSISEKLSTQLTNPGKKQVGDDF